MISYNFVKEAQFQCCPWILGQEILPIFLFSTKHFSELVLCWANVSIQNFISMPYMERCISLYINSRISWFRTILLYFNSIMNVWKMSILTLIVFSLSFLPFSPSITYPSFSFLLPIFPPSLFFFLFSFLPFFFPPFLPFSLFLEGSNGKKRTEVE